MDDKLTPEEKAFASKNHDLVYSYLCYRKYNTEEFYDIVVFGYLDAVKAYLRKDSLKQFSFSTIAYRYMQGRIAHHFSGLNRKKNAGQTVSLNEAMGDDNKGVFANLIGIDEIGFDNAEFGIYKSRLFSQCSKIQLETFLLSVSGYDCMEIAKLHGVSVRTVQYRRQTAIRKMKEEYRNAVSA